jgi:PKHD-type hydroxylase
MNLENYYWYFEKALSDKFCNKIINIANKNKKHLAKTFGVQNKKLSKKDALDLKKQRNSNIVWLSENWIYDEIYPFINAANKNAGWNFDFDWSEPCQFTIYKKEQHYDWHCDSNTTPYPITANENFIGKIRKLSVTCSLSDPKDYEGGELEFDFRNSIDGKPVVKKCIEIKPKGSIVVFPSHVYHRVTPVTKGTRYSLVIWSLGYPFK